MDIMPCIPLEAYSHVYCRKRLILHIKEGREGGEGREGPYTSYSDDIL